MRRVTDIARQADACPQGQPQVWPAELAMVPQGGDPPASSPATGTQGAVAGTKPVDAGASPVQTASDVDPLHPKRVTAETAFLPNASRDRAGFRRLAMLLVLAVMVFAALVATYYSQLSSPIAAVPLVSPKATSLPLLPTAIETSRPEDEQPAGADTRVIASDTAPATFSLFGDGPESIQPRVRQVFPDLEPTSEPEFEEPAVADVQAYERILVTRSAPLGEPNNDRVQSAYQAYLDGEYKVAGQQYEDILAIDPGHRDALLGLAAVSLQLGDVDVAEGHYARLLAADPSDPIAIVAMADLTGPVDEVQLKRLLEREPAVSNLHFSLGNLYAVRGRWLDAHRAYLDAYRLDGANPDTAYNLAIALERIGLPLQAAEFYRAALGLRQGRVARFDSHQAVARLAHLDRLALQK